MAALVSLDMKALTSAEKSPLKLDPSCSIQVPCTNLPWLQVPSCWLEVACSLQHLALLSAQSWLQQRAGAHGWYM